MFVVRDPKLRNMKGGNSEEEEKQDEKINRRGSDGSSACKQKVIHLVPRMGNHPFCNIMALC